MGTMMDHASGLDPMFWNGKSVFLTGHTGFKGSWLTLLLAGMGAKVHGYALNPPTTPSLFEQAQVADGLAGDVRADLADQAALQSAMDAARPDIILHLAAQPLVRESYREPVATMATNVLGTAHVLDSARRAEGLRAVVSVTTDKCYENVGWIHPYRETDPMGGHDPYSASKGAAELVTASFRSSFFHGAGAARIATARAGNVIGGGDWAEDRLIPDCMRAFQSGQPVTLRFPDAIRPWQHVLECLTGYLLLAQRLCGADGADFAAGWNFGPRITDEGSVLSMAQLAANAWGNGAEIVVEADSDGFAEASVLRLDSSKAQIMLGWTNRWEFSETIARTIEWYRLAHEGADMRDVTEAQIAAFKAAG